MTPFRFGPAERQLFGAYHPAALGEGPSRALLICNPFGQEAVRTHRLFHVLAERLARQGVHVLRFDYRGTGDSAGDDTEGQLDLWQADILLAHHELQRRAMCQRVSWLGVRLGGSLAALASTRAQRKPDHLFMWEPIAQGRHYLAQLAREHHAALAGSYSVVPKAFRAAPRHEAMGFGISPVMHEQLAALNVANWPALRLPALTLVNPNGNPSHAAWAQWLGRCEGLRHSTAFDHSLNWCSEEAINSALVPHEALEFWASLILNTPAAVPATASDSAQPTPADKAPTRASA